MACRSTSSSRSISSDWARIETYSPAAMEKAPATKPAMPARRTVPDRGVGAGHAEDEGDVGDQTVADAEDRGAGSAPLQVPVSMVGGHIEQRTEPLRVRMH